MKKFTFYKLLSLVLILVLSVSTIKSFTLGDVIETEAVFTAEMTEKIIDLKPINTKPILLKTIGINEVLNRQLLLTDFKASEKLKATEVIEETNTEKEEEDVVEEPIIVKEEPEVVKEPEPKKEPELVKEPEPKKEQEVINAPQVTGTYSDWEIYEWAKIVYCEAGGESQKCKEYVAQVILNRINSSRFPNTVHGVIFDGIQFSPTFDGSWERKEPNQACYDAVYTVINAAQPLTNALFFEACRGDSWHSRNLTEVAAVDNTRFYTY